MVRGIAGRFGGRLHYSWVVMGVVFLCLLAAAGIRATPGVLMVPWQQGLGWSRATISLAIAINVFLYGLMGLGLPPPACSASASAAPCSVRLALLAAGGGGEHADDRHLAADAEPGAWWSEPVPASSPWCSPRRWSIAEPANGAAW